ncbi:glucose PTS transporter subunit IIA [Lactiplantibacillus carotarum]|uniref:glucose PTS transporter subunit IIA n=1 Tax=Lactiplantibacillus carotarum TaxID=2993456 RepID=UPI00298F1689|nr:glucose PTS transporter subunit IIA [Lactiplantibacillus carotarum]
MSDQREPLTIQAPVEGQLMPLSAVNDGVFSAGMAGTGFAIEPGGSQVCAPVAGTVTLITPTKHAVGLRTNTGMDVLVHVGIDTVELGGAPFQVSVQAGQTVTAGQPLLTMDLTAIRRANKRATVMTLLTNLDQQRGSLYLAVVDQAVRTGDVVAILRTPLLVAKPAISRPSELGRVIVQGVGGAQNVRRVRHCMTRLRFNLVDQQAAQTATIQALPGVIAVTTAADQYQVVIGQDVTVVYEAVTAELAAAKGAPPAQKSPIEHPKIRARIWQGLSRVIKVMTGAMMPVIGILAGAGILKGLLAALTSFKVLSTTGGTALILNAVADAPFYFLPLILGITAAKQLGSDPIVLAVVGGTLVYPNLVTAAGNAATAQISFLGLPTHLVAYAATVFPIIVVAWLATYVERGLKRWLPRNVAGVLRPIMETLILVTVVLVGIGPLITMLSREVANGLVTVYNVSPALSGFLIGGLYQVMVIFGLHWGLVPIIINDLTTNGHSYLNAIISVTMVAQGGAALAVFLKSKHQPQRELALAAAVAAFCGITEPALYGVNLKFKRVFVVASLASAVGGGLTGLLRVNNFALSGALIGFPAFITPNVGIDGNFYGYLISHYGTLILATGLVYLFGYSDQMLTRKTGTTSANKTVKSEVK